jgi:hypothetical protein
LATPPVGWLIALQFIMRTHHRALAAASLIAAGTLSASAQQPVGIDTTRTVARTTVATAAVSRARAVGLTMIQGNALDSTNGAMNDAVVRLRDARFGRIVDTQMTDKSGLFTFKAMDPGAYIVEVVAKNESVMAASQLLNVNPGEAVSAVVKLPFRAPALAGVLGNAGAPSATAVAMEAAAGGIASVVPTQPISPVQ